MIVVMPRRKLLEWFTGFQILACLIIWASAVRSAKPTLIPTLNASQVLKNYMDEVVRGTRVIRAM